MRQIQKGIPIPERRQGEPRYVHLWCKMNDGDSFLIPGTEQARNSVRTSARSKGVTIVTRREGENIRVWKVGDMTSAEINPGDNGEPGSNSEKPMLTVVK